MKRSWECPKCESARVGYLERLPDAGQSGKLGRMIGGASPPNAGRLTLLERVGEVEAFICADCGYFEEYVKAPQTIPWDQVKHFRWCRS